MPHKKFILLSFDVEEFDMPVEFGQNISEDEQLSVGYEGLDALMNIIEPSPVEASFFTTANFAQNYPGAIRKIAQDHEIASHTFYHSRFAVEDLAGSKKKLEEIISKEVYGLRMPRMREVNLDDVESAGYQYDSSVNPTWIPGRYNNRHLSRTPYLEKNLLRIPASVTPFFRIPLFWLSFKNLPYNLYLRLAIQTLKKDGYICLYFHPWEFISLDKYKVPGYTKKHAGKALSDRLNKLIKDLSCEGSFISMNRYIREEMH